MKNYKGSKDKYLPDSVGKKMIKNVPIASLNQTILDVKNMLFEKMKELETINYIYVVDENKKLRGIFSIKEIFQKPQNSKVKEIMETEIVKVKSHIDQERVAILALTHNLKAIPVVDKRERFLGIVTSDSILDILHSEHVEDFLKSAGIHSPLAKISKASFFFLAKARIPWLTLGLLGGTFAAKIVDFFETPLRTHFILAAFIPLIVYIADAVGTQTETLFIRNLVLETQFEVKKYFLREVKTGFLIALVLGTIIYLLSVFTFNSSYFVGIILGTSLFLTVLASISIGIFIPFVLQKLKKDPALGSGPFATIITDITSLIIYFSIASLMLKMF